MWSITINNIVIDDWKNCADIQKYLDNQGIDNYVDTIGMDEKIFENYKILKNFSKINEIYNNYIINSNIKRLL